LTMIEVNSVDKPLAIDYSSPDPKIFLDDRRN